MLEFILMTEIFVFFSFLLFYNKKVTSPFPKLSQQNREPTYAADSGLPGLPLELRINNL